jgi:hypothetical protein
LRQHSIRAACIAFVAAWTTACLGMPKQAVMITPPPPIMPAPVAPPAPPPLPPPVALPEPERIAAASVPPMPEPPPVSAEFADATAQLRTIPMFEAIYEFDRPTFDQLAKMVVEAGGSSAPRTSVLEKSGPILQPRIMRYLRFGSDQAVVAFYQMVIRQFDAGSKTVAGCKALLAGGGAPGIDAGNGLATFIELQVVLTDLIRSQRGQKIEALMEPERAAAYMVDIMGALTQDPNDLAILQGGKAAEANPMRQCELTSNLLKAIAKQEQGVAADLFRFLGAQGQRR